MKSGENLRKPHFPVFLTPFCGKPRSVRLPAPETAAKGRIGPCASCEASSQELQPANPAGLRRFSVAPLPTGSAGEGLLSDEHPRRREADPRRCRFCRGGTTRCRVRAELSSVLRAFVSSRGGLRAPGQLLTGIQQVAGMSPRLVPEAGLLRRASSIVSRLNCCLPAPR